MTNINMVFARILFIEVVVFALVQMSTKSEGIFYQINDQLLAVMDGVLISLNIDKNFAKSKNVMDYLAMYNIVQDTVEKNDREYEKVIEISKTEICSKIAYFVSNINEIIEEMIRQKNVKHLSDVSDKNNNTRYEDDVLLDFVNLGKSLNIKINAPSSDLRLWNSELSRVSLNTRRIYGGNRTTIKKYPFMASVHVNGRFTCSGSLIREDLVLTAASCLIQVQSRKFNGTKIKVRVGSEFAKKSGKVVSVVDIRVHPHFNKTTLNHNLVILRLKKPLKFRRRTLIGIKIDKEAKAMPKNVDGVVILGWGQQNSNIQASKLERRLSKAFVHVYNFKDCINIYSRAYVTSKNFCTGYSDKASGACHNDIGGPAIVGSTLIGVISFGSPHCGRPGTPTVFTNIGYYADWIAKVFKTIPSKKKIVSKNIFNKTIEKLMSQEIYDYSDETDNTNELHILKKITRDLKVERQNPIKYDFYDSFDNNDTFESTKPRPVHKHPLIDKSIFLNPELVQLPEFSDSDETSMLLFSPVTKPIPNKFQPPNKEKDELNVYYQEFVSQLLKDALTTPMTWTRLIKPSTTTTNEPIEWPLEYLNFSASDNAYGDFAFETTTLYLGTDEVTSPKAMTRMGASAPSGESKSDTSEPDGSNDADVKSEYELPPNINRPRNRYLEKSKANDTVEVIFLNSGSTKRFVFSKKDPDITNELTRLKKKFFT